ncbi:unnamed protein product [Vitrella brassicaformis CCMP3155]|uniref:Uncharacterized protein n=1 Tax=Vitrella brassicaformis (strain CCMP3155) TaxID=1169540 RepID=A0A0G4EZH8_VITBC|nr:unnamed protein product [Vitrella brassicaformis CCMP3155]|eukprot:CEM04414.1 unnamed protein product [Vitrella brassicaformis CCMP3155]
MQQPQHHQQQHPFSYIFVDRRTYWLLSIEDVVRLRATCTWLRDLFGAVQLRDRLRHSVGSQAGLRRVVNGRQVQLLGFDDDQFGTHDLLAAVCVVEQGPWDEIGEVLEVAAQFAPYRYCYCANCIFDDLPPDAEPLIHLNYELPGIITADDIR